MVTFCASISSQGIQATDERFFTINQEWSKLPDRLVLALPPMSDMPENTGFVNVINHRQANNNRFNLRTFYSMALKFYGWAYFMMPNKMERVR